MKTGAILYIDAVNKTHVLQDGFHRDSVKELLVRDSLSISVADAKEYRHEGIKMPFTIEQADSVFGLLLLCFLFFAHIYNGGLTFLQENFTLLISSEKNKRTYKQTTSREIFYSYFLIFQAIVLMSIAIYDVFLEYSPVSSDYLHRPLITIPLFILSIGLFMGLKDLMYRILGYIFDTNTIFSAWRRTHIIALEVLGILYFVPTLFLIYAGYYHFQIIIFMLILFLIVQLLLFYQIIIFFIREKFNFLYLIAYLCTFEIIPYIFLFLGLGYLYRFEVFSIL